MSATTLCQHSLQSTSTTHSLQLLCYFKGQDCCVLIIPFPTVSHLFDAVRVDSGLWLQYADWFGFLGALGHFADFLRNEVVDTIESFDCTLYQTYTFCCSCTDRERKEDNTVRELQ